MELTVNNHLYEIVFVREHKYNAISLSKQCFFSLLRSNFKQIIPLPS